MTIYTLSGYYEKVQEKNDLMDLRDRIEERGGETSNLEKVIDEIGEALSEYKKNNEKEFIEGI